MCNIVSVRNLTMRFGERKVLNGINLEVPVGKTLAIIGPSGTGKSTIIKILTGLVRPTGGSVIINGQETSAYDEKQWDELRKHMGVVFQYSALFDFLSVGDNVAFGLRRHFHLSEDEIGQRVSTLLSMVGMPDTEELWPSELSGGMKKRVGFARAMAMQPQIMLYDEPTSGLDPVMTTVISRLIREAQNKMGLTSVLVTHDMASVFQSADLVAMLYEGNIVAFETADSIRTCENPIVRAFINGQNLPKETENEQ